MNNATPLILQDQGWEAYTDETFIGHIGSIYARTVDGMREYGILTGASHRNLSGAVHGGVMLTMFDRVMGENVRRIRQGERFATASMTVDFLRSVTVGDFMSLTATVMKTGRKTVFMRAEAFVSDRLVGAASGVFMTIG